MEKKLNDYLHLYLGCDCIVNASKYLSGTGKDCDLNKAPAIFDSINRNTLINQHIGITFKCGEMGILYIDVFGKLCNRYSMFVHPENISLVLRPLSSMTEAEYIEWGSKFYPNLITGTSEMIEQEAERTRWLLSKHFDLFDLIGSGLAIDASTLK